MIIDHRIDDGMILRDEVSDEAVEAAAFMRSEGFQLLCIVLIVSLVPSDPLQSYSAPIRPL